MAASADAGDLRPFAEQLIADLCDALESASGRTWLFHSVDGAALDSDNSRRGADFVGEATLRLTEGSFDLMIVLTDVILVSSSERIVSGVTSPLTRICVISTRQLRTVKRGPELPLDAPQVRWNAAALALNLIGRVLGAKSGGMSRGAMRPYTMDPERAKADAFDEADQIRSRADRLVEPEYRTGTVARELAAHVRALVAEPLRSCASLHSSKASHDSFLAGSRPARAFRSCRWRSVVLDVCWIRALARPFFGLRRTEYAEVAASLQKRKANSAGVFDSLFP